MGGPKLSERAQQNHLRQRMRAEGVLDAGIAAEFGRRYRMRPRKAWRHTHGWTLREAAERINALAANDGLDPGSKAGMTAAHLCEYEEWPGEALPGSGREPSGRKPTPYILSLLARAYATTVPALVDEADQAWLPPADRLVIGELGALALTGGPGVTNGGQGQSGGEADVWAQAELLVAAEEARSHARRAARRDVGDVTLERVRADLARLSQGYMNGEPFPLFLQMRSVRSSICGALDVRLWPHDEAELYFLLSLVNGLMAVAARDLGNGSAGEELARAAWTYATIIGYGPLMAYLRTEQASASFWAGRPQISLDYTASGLAYMSRGPNAARLHLQHGRAAARLGDAGTARRSIAAAMEAREQDYRDELLEIGGQFGFSLATQHYLTGATLAELPGAEREAAAELERASEMYERGPGPGEHHSSGCAALTSVALATVRLRAGELDGAAAALAPVFARPRAKRIDWLTPGLGRVRAELAEPRYRSAGQATDLDARIEHFIAESAISALAPRS
jgi:hypothetical protein